MYHVYILRCADGKLYTGITTDLKRRVEEHEASLLGAKFTRGRGPFAVVYTRPFPDRSSATREEHRIKSLTRAQKILLMASV